MALNVEIPPAELTGYAREVAAVIDNDVTFELLPNEFVDDVVFHFTVNARRHQVAQYRAFDSETAIGGGEDAEEKTARLLPVGLKIPFGEYDQLRRRGANSPETVQARAEALLDDVVRATVDRVRLARAEALVKGSLTLNENRVRQTVDFQRRAEFTITAANFWDTEAGTPIDDLTLWSRRFRVVNGTPATRMIISEHIAAALQLSPQVRAQVGIADGEILSLDRINQLFTSLRIPQVTVEDALIGDQRLFPAETLVMTAPGVGLTPWGSTVEADDPRYGLEGNDLPGLVAGIYDEDDPATKWIRANAISFPVLLEADRSLAATVLSEVTE